MKIAIASGKGGTGKTFVSSNLVRSYKKQVALLDCDVEEPNNSLFLKGDIVEQRRHAVLVPKLQSDLCDGCRVCQQVCEFNSIIVMGGKAMVFEDLCHSCGACTLMCPQKALYEVDHEIGTIVVRKSKNVAMVEGLLDVGKALAVPLIRKVKSYIKQFKDIPIIIDSPPGTSCPMVWTIESSDYVILVVESTAFGFHDFKIAINTVKDVNLPFGVVINKDGLGDDRVEKYCLKNNIPILARIPFSIEVATSYSKGDLLVEVDPVYQKTFEKLWEELINRVKSGAKDEK
jgi:MinD superfamily P-loop ATPase